MGIPVLCFPAGSHAQHGGLRVRAGGAGRNGGGLDTTDRRFDIADYDGADDHDCDDRSDPLRRAVTSGMAIVRTSDPPGRRPEGFLMPKDRRCG